MIIRLTALCFAAALAARADLLSDALFSLPSDTDYLEYDHLAALRNLPSYQRLKKQFAGQPLEQASAALARIGIAENQVAELISAQTPHAFFALVAGAFHSPPAANHKLHCAPRQSCVVFLEDSLAAIGSQADLKVLLDTRQGIHTRLGSNAKLASVLRSTDKNAPVRGVLAGGQLRGAIAGALRDISQLNSDWSELASKITAIGYSVRFPTNTTAHISIEIECTSSASAMFLSSSIKALASVQSLTGSAAIPYQNIQASASSQTVLCQADTTIESLLNQQ